MQRINEDIKTGNFKQIYLLYGEERYLKNQYTTRLRKALCQDGDEMNTHFYQGKDFSLGQVIDLAETLPFLAERRVMFFKDTGLFKSGGEKLAEYLASPNDTTFFVFTESEVDKRSKLYKTVQSKGYVAEFTVQDENSLKHWIAGILICYCLDRDVVTAEDVEAVCTTRITNHIFDMVNAIAEKQPQKALQLYYDLLALKEPPMRVLFLIARQCNLLLQTKELKNRGHDNKTIASKIGVPPFAVGKYVAQASHFKTSVLKNAVKQCVETEEAVKSGRMNDMMSVEILILSVLPS